MSKLNATTNKYLLWLYATRTMVMLLLISIILPFAYLFGAFDSNVNILKNADKYSLNALSLGSTSSDISIDDNLLYGLCNVPQADPQNLCGFAINTTSDPTRGLDLSGYDYLRISTKGLVPNKSYKVRALFKHFDPIFSRPEDPVSFKYNSIIVPIGPEQSTLMVPLSDIGVEAWWIKEYDIPVYKSKVDLTNVGVFEITSEEPNGDGIYEFEITEVSFIGKTINITVIQFITMGLWLLIIVMLVMRNRQMLSAQARTDHLTKLPNRNGISWFLQKQSASKKRPVKMGIIYIDIDNFKNINDTYGHDAGDEILCAFARLVTECFERSPISHIKTCFARLAGDEFVIFCVNISVEELTSYTEYLYKQLASPMNLSFGTYAIGTSAGAAVGCVYDTEAKVLLKKADDAMYFAKQRGKNQVAFYNQEIEVAINNSMQIELNTNNTLEQMSVDSAYAIYCRPLVSLQSQRIDRFRFQLSNSTQQSIEQAISGHKQPIDKQKIQLIIARYVLKTAMQLIKNNAQWLRKNKITSIIPIGKLAIQDESFINDFIAELPSLNIERELIFIEFSELVDEDNWVKIKSGLTNLSVAGVGLSIDNFFENRGELKLLKTYNIRNICLHKSLLDDLRVNQTDGNWCKQLINMAQHTNVTIETPELHAMDDYLLLSKLGANYANGYVVNELLEYEKLVGLVETTNALD